MLCFYIFAKYSSKLLTYDDFDFSLKTRDKPHEANNDNLLFSPVCDKSLFAKMPN